MASRTRVFNETTQRYVPLAQAEGWVRDGACAWVAKGATICRLTVAEMAAPGGRLSAEREFLRLSPAERLKEAKKLMPLAELRGLMVTGLADIQVERQVARVSTYFAASELAGVCQ